MKKILLLVLLALFSVAPAYAEGGHGFGHGHGGHEWGHGGGWGWGGGWVAPALVGGLIVYDVTRPYPDYVQPYPVYAQPAPVVAAPAVQSWYYCTEANAYYPYVASCPSAWKVVPATPPR